MSATPTTVKKNRGMGVIISIGVILFALAAMSYAFIKIINKKDDTQTCTPPQILDENNNTCVDPCPKGTDRIPGVGCAMCNPNDETCNACLTNTECGTGVCYISGDGKRGVCMCNPGTYGIHCENICIDNTDCKNGGQCKNGKCHCDDLHYTGDKCEIEKCVCTPDKYDCCGDNTSGCVNGECVCNTDIVKGFWQKSGISGKCDKCVLPYTIESGCKQQPTFKYGDKIYLSMSNPSTTIMSQLDVLCDCGVGLCPGVHRLTSTLDKNNPNIGVVWTIESPVPGNIGSTVKSGDIVYIKNNFGYMGSCGRTDNIGAEASVISFEENTREPRHYTAIRLDSAENIEIGKPLTGAFRLTNIGINLSVAAIAKTTNEDCQNPSGTRFSYREEVLGFNVWIVPVP